MCFLNVSTICGMRSDGKSLYSLNSTKKHVRLINIRSWLAPKYDVNLDHYRVKPDPKLSLNVANI